MSSTYKLYKEWWRVNSKYNSKELQHFGFSFCFTNLWSTLWYGWPIGRIPILRYISAMSHTRTIGYLQNLRSTLIKSCWSFGPEWMISSNNFPSRFAELSYNILTFVVNLLVGMTGKSGKNHPVMTVLQKNSMRFSGRILKLLLYQVLNQHLIKVNSVVPKSKR